MRSGLYIKIANLSGNLSEVLQDDTMWTRFQTAVLLGILTGLAGWLPGAHAQATPLLPPAVPPTVTQASPSVSSSAAMPPVKVTILTDATPALWKLQGVHGLVYLFGSVHVMKKEVHWETTRIKDAFASSGALYLEIAEMNPTSQKAAVPIIMKYGMDAAHPLSTKVSKADLTLLEAAAKKLGQPGEQSFEPMQPWLANLLIALLPAVNAGYEATTGIDMTLDAEALAAKKPVIGFETIEDQLHLFADAPMTEQVEALHKTLTNAAPDNTKPMDEIVGDWTRGDVDKLAAIENRDMSPKLYDRMLVKRNQRFANAIEAILKNPNVGNVFVCVGAAHLAGPDSVQKMLAQKGFVAERVQ